MLQERGTSIRDTGAIIYDSFAQAIYSFMSFLPALIGAIIVLIIGWIISGLLARLIVRLLNMIGFERAVERSGISDFIRKSGTRWTTSQVIGELIKWFIRLIFIQAAANILRMEQVTTIINSIVLFIPNLIVAVVIIVIGALIARFLSAAVRASLSEMDAGNANLMATLTQYAIIGFAVIAAANQLGIATVVVNTLFIGLVAAIALAAGLSLGLGGRDVGAQVMQSLYEGGQRMAGQQASRSQPGPIRPTPPRETAGPQ